MDPSTATPPHRFSRPVRTSGAWSVWWRTWYRLLRLAGRPLVRLARARGFGNVVVMRVTGRHSGRELAVPLGSLTVDGRAYIGHPNGDTAWTLNVRAASTLVIESARVGQLRVRPTVMPPGPERDAVVRATFRQHPFPGNALYRLAARHVFANGVFFRLEPETDRP